MLFHFCFAALSNSRGEYLLNGDFVVSMFKREVRVGNAVIEYSGSDHVVERINCTDRIEEEIIIQVIWLHLMAFMLAFMLFNIVKSHNFTFEQFRSVSVMFKLFCSMIFLV